MKASLIRLFGVLTMGALVCVVAWSELDAGTTGTCQLSNSG